MCVPVLPVAFQKRTPETVPNRSLVNLTPTSIAPGSPLSAFAGVVAVPQIEHGHVTGTVTPAPGTCRLPLSSTARHLIVAAGLPCAIHAYDQLVVPSASCHVVPPSVETSTPATTPPPVSAAVPRSVTRSPSPTVAGGSVIAAAGAVLSADGEAATSPGCSVAACAPMSANRLTVAWRMVPSAVACGWKSSSPHAHCTVPAPNTRAPLGARYIVRLWVAVPPSLVVLP
jgi:hypothetical protein